jgi:hypothetical protein
MEGWTGDLPKEEPMEAPVELDEASASASDDALRSEVGAAKVPDLSATVVQLILCAIVIAACAFAGMQLANGITQALENARKDMRPLSKEEQKRSDATFNLLLEIAPIVGGL